MIPPTAGLHADHAQAVVVRGGPGTRRRGVRDGCPRALCSLCGRHYWRVERHAGDGARLCAAWAAVVLAARCSDALDARQGVRRPGRAPSPCPPTSATPTGGGLAAEADRRTATLTRVNNAAVSAYGPFEDPRRTSLRRVVETNLLGTLYGAHAALRRFREQGRASSSTWLHRGEGQPYPTPYAAPSSASAA